MINIRALTIAGFDPSGGAGVLADIKTFHALGVYGTAVVTSLTAQNVKRVARVQPVDPDFIETQLDLIMEESNIIHAKTGMLFSPQIVKLVARKVREYQLKVVVDPVLVAGSGGQLYQKDLAQALKKHLLPLAELSTPNISEAQILSGMKIKSEEDAKKAATELSKISPVVITGGHLEGRDIYYNSKMTGAIKVIDGKIVDTVNTHGSGCTYSAAVTAFRAQGKGIEDSLVGAASFVENSIKKGKYGTLNQFWKLYSKDLA
jgi:hydroxymethylpyrimidine/phosphomethylpyrimidine kinase